MSHISLGIIATICGIFRVHHTHRSSGWVQICQPPDFGQTISTAQNHEVEDIISHSPSSIRLSTPYSKTKSSVQIVWLGGRECAVKFDVQNINSTVLPQPVMVLGNLNRKRGTPGLTHITGACRSLVSIHVSGSQDYPL